MPRRLLPFFLLAATCCQAGEPELDLETGGSFKSLNFIYEAPQDGGWEDGATSANRLRLDLTGTAGHDLTGELSLENLLLASEPAGQILLPGTPEGRIADLAWDWQDGHQLSNRIEVDRLNIRGVHDLWEWQLGRQAIGFGRISLSSPLDIIAPFSPDALDTSVRPGVDAVRITRFHGLAGQWAAVGVFGDSWERNCYLAALTDNLAETDVLALGGGLAGRGVIGGGLAGQVRGAGLKVEATWYDGTAKDLHSTFAIAGVETDFQLFGELTIFCQYLFNGAGAEDPSGYPAAALSAMVQEGLSYLLGQQYLLLAPTWQLHPLCSLSFLLIENLEDGSGMLRPLVNVSLADNLSLEAYVTVNFGRSPVSPGEPLSEFGGLGTGGGVYLQYFF